ncbi:MAG TPA: metallophosphoesterase [Anaeromyxobacteraceae bacterium]|nr:metallophosphoesterase [Anaeromyxobacteraceae bacterium]
MSRPLLSFVIFFGVALAIVGGMHFYIWTRLVRDTAVGEPWRRLLTVGLVALAVAVPVSFVAMRARAGALADGFVFGAMLWMGVAFLLLSSLVAVDLVRLAASGIGSLVDWLRHAPEAPADPERRRLVARAVAGTAVLAAGGATAFAVSSALGDPEIHEVPVKLARLPRALSGLTIAQISDLHVGRTIGEDEVRRVVAATNRLRPDVVAITGDLVDGSVAMLERSVAPLAAIQARYGVFFVTGNHEYYSGAQAWVAHLARLGIRVLRNERVAIGDAGASIDLAGIDDWRSAGMAPGHGPDLARALAGRDPERSLVLLAHQPRGVEEGAQAGVELQVSGHTHGGQIFPFSLATALVYPYLHGLYPVRGGAGGQIFVSRGTGYWGPPMRLGSPPEITRLVLT